MYAFFDAETTGIPKSYKAPYTNVENWPRLVELAWEVYSTDGQKIEGSASLIKPGGFKIPIDAERIHGISTQKATAEGKPLSEVLKDFLEALPANLTALVGHNLSYDKNIVAAELYRLNGLSRLNEAADPEAAKRFMARPGICTMKEATNYCKIPGRYGKYKFPTLEELHRKLFGNGFEKAHSALADVEACARCFFRLRELGVVQPTIF